MTDQFEAKAREIACAANGYCDGPVDSVGHGLGCNETYAAILAVLRSAVEAERIRCRDIALERAKWGREMYGSNYRAHMAHHIANEIAAPSVIAFASDMENEAGQREIDRLSSEVDLLTKVLRELYDAAYDDGGALSVELGQKVSLALKRSRTAK